MIELLHQTDIMIIIIISTYIIWISTGVVLKGKTKGIESILVVLSTLWIISHIYSMIRWVDVDIVFNVVGAWVIAEIAWIRSAKKLWELIEKGSDLKDTINIAKWKK